MSTEGKIAAFPHHISIFVPVHPPQDGNECEGLGREILQYVSLQMRSLSSVKTRRLYYCMRHLKPNVRQMPDNASLPVKLVQW